MASSRSYSAACPIRRDLPVLRKAARTWRLFPPQRLPDPCRSLRPLGGGSAMSTAYLTGWDCLRHRLFEAPSAAPTTSHRRRAADRACIGAGPPAVCPARLAGAASSLDATPPVPARAELVKEMAQSLPSLDARTMVRSSPSSLKEVLSGIDRKTHLQASLSKHEAAAPECRQRVLIGQAAPSTLGRKPTSATSCSLVSGGHRSRRRSP